MNTNFVLLNNINAGFDQVRDTEFLNHVTKLCGQENFRPKLDHIKERLTKDVAEIESFAKVVVIGGTNGKGETSHCLRQLLTEDGFSVLMWTSPHVLSIRERFVINDSVASYDELSQVASISEKRFADEGLSFYEFLFVSFIELVRIKRPDYVILEVGLGGRFDAVNIFTEPLTLLTSISRDHTKILGHKLKDILFEKYGITRNGTKLISGIDQSFLKDTLTSWCARDQIELIQITGDSYIERNRKMALEAFSILTGKTRALLSVSWQCTKGRFETIRVAERDFIFVGAHNIDGHRKLLELLNFSRQNNCSTNVSDTVMLLSFSTGREDQVEDILSLYKSYPCLFESVFVTSFSGDRSMEKEIIEKLNSLFDFESNWNNFFDDKYKNKTIYISGSYYFIAAFQLFILSR
ncbi:hypothetical protein [Bacteriovorax sp. Seq25_V]|uniref:hypothetical protein n=1 Tax=Bacteriovorax sp. Seq25_V TaxID=1201288 RepID=UPI000389FE43|nr:hypothetical protein [Bacteriovorax sp. Seq25_V]EQC44181.1 hypothetical protein M900_A0275 [Bacteriovorax sp. Seq25_V]